MVIYSVDSLVESKVVYWAWMLGIVTAVNSVVLTVPYLDDYWVVK